MRHLRRDVTCRTLRYVSGAGDTPADRIEDLRRHLPPKEGRRSRIGHLSKDDFAELVGASRGRVIAWTTGVAYPEPRYRVRLAELSEGRYQPDDFAPPNHTARQAELGAAVDRMERILEALADRVESLERQAAREGQAKNAGQ